VFPVEDQQTTPPRQFPLDLGGLERGNLERPGAVVYELLVVMNQTWYAAARRVDAANLDSALGNHHLDFLVPHAHREIRTHGAHSDVLGMHNEWTLCVVRDLEGRLACSQEDRPLL